MHSLPCGSPLLQNLDTKSTVDILDSIADRNLRKHAPDGGVIASQEAWDKLVKAWDIKDAPKVDFNKEFLYVGTTFHRELRIYALWPDKKGDLKVFVIDHFDECPGFFCYRIKSFNRNWVKTVNGRGWNDEAPRAWRK